MYYLRTVWSMHIFSTLTFLFYTDVSYLPNLDLKCRTASSFSGCTNLLHKGGVWISGKQESGGWRAAEGWAGPATDAIVSLIQEVTYPVIEPVIKTMHMKTSTFTGVRVRVSYCNAFFVSQKNSWPFYSFLFIYDLDWLRHSN